MEDRTTVIGQQINQYLQNKSNVEDHCIHLLFSANRWEARNSILDDLRNGITIVCDRYFASGVAFTAAKGYDIDWCFAPDRGLPSPDIVLFLDLDPEEQQKRGGFGEERYEVGSFQQKVRGKFKEMIRSLTEINWVVVNANGTPDAVFEELTRHVQATIEKCGDKPVSVLFCVFK
jgi:dTMP kinase